MAQGHGILKFRSGTHSSQRDLPRRKAVASFSLFYAVGFFLACLRWRGSCKFAQNFSGESLYLALCSCFWPLSIVAAQVQNTSNKAPSTKHQVRSTKYKAPSTKYEY